MSNFKYIYKIQQALNDFLKLKLFDSNYKFTISKDKKTTKINLGSILVKDIIQIDLSLNKTIPITFHGTSDLYYEDIKKFGIVPPSSTSNKQWDKFYTNESNSNVYLSTDFEVATKYAKHTVVNLKQNYDIKSKPIIIEIRDLDINNVLIDDDMELDVGFAQLLNSLQTGKNKKDYISSIRQNTQFAVKGRIPYNKIYKIHRL